MSLALVVLDKQVILMIYDLIEVAISTVGNDMIKTKSRNSYF